MKYLLQRGDGSMPSPADFSKSQEEINADEHYAHIARQMKTIFPRVREIITDMASLRNSNAEAGDVIYCPHRLGEPALAWILRNPKSGEAELLGSNKIEDLEWYMQFGHLELLGK